MESPHKDSKPDARVCVCVCVEELGGRSTLISTICGASLI